MGAARSTVHVVLLLGLQLLWEAARDSSRLEGLTLWQRGLLVTMVIWQLVVWSSVLFFRALDRHLAAGSAPPSWMGAVGKLRLPARKHEPSLRRKLPVALRNMVSIFVAIVLGFSALERASTGTRTGTGTGTRGGGWFSARTGTGTHGGGWFYGAEGESAYFALRVGRTALLTLLHYATSDVMFYSGHRAMHTWRWLRQAHAVHHSSWASCALGGYYMGPLDFFLEHGPVFVSWALWREVGAAWPVSVCVGAWNLLATHSAWDVRWGPDPRGHFLHHNGGKQGLASNLGIFLDHAFGTKLEPDSLPEGALPMDRVGAEAGRGAKPP